MRQTAAQCPQPKHGLTDLGTATIDLIDPSFGSVTNSQGLASAVGIRRRPLVDAAITIAVLKNSAVQLADRDRQMQ